MEESFDVERIAAIIHQAMRFDRENKTPAWQGGNSLAEDVARRAAREAISLMESKAAAITAEDQVA
jgi:beta-glucosidase-like glycosyl hydrolase